MVYIQNNTCNRKKIEASADNTPQTTEAKKTEVNPLFNKSNFNKPTPVIDSKQTASLYTEIKSNVIVPTKITSVYGNPVKVAESVKGPLEKVYDGLKQIGINLKIADSYREKAEQQKTYESGKPGVVSGEKSYHPKGLAIDLAQVPEMNNQKVFDSLKQQGFKQHPGEWWHWSVGEFKGSSKPAAKPVVQTTTQTVSKPVTKPVTNIVSKPINQNVNKSVISKTTRKDEEEKGTIGKIADYIIEAPWSKPSEITQYFSRIYDTKQRSDGKNLVEDKVIQTPTLTKPVVKQPIVTTTKSNGKTVTVKNTQPATNYSKVTLGKTHKDDDGLVYGRSVVDMADGIRVTYQPRNEKKDKRSDIDNAIMVSDYLYNMDFTDNYKHEYAQNDLNTLRYRVKNNDFRQKFVQVRTADPNNKGEYIVRVLPTSKLKDADFDNNNVYDQSYAKLSDFDFSPDGKKIKLTNYAEKWKASLFKGQGLPYMDKNEMNHGLRLPGGKNNFGRYQDINSLDQFGPYLGGTVTIISDDGTIVKKVTGSVKDIMNTALNIKSKTGGKEVHFLQSDAGSMNVKALAINNKLSKKQLGILRNLEPWAGAAEILINK